ncbi:hypothetical protein HMPREF1320_1287 [Capnocytophaga sp. oral taxon 335 str. F0486]|nr:hypothetical protein HMPREF1320_1287 [Capnocytophaga sp. oral taxon 335 str. F0486]
MQRYNNNKKYQYPNLSHSINPLISNFLYTLPFSYFCPIYHRASSFRRHIPTKLLQQIC